MMKTLKAPEGVLSATAMGKPVEIVDGICEVQDYEAEELKAHGFVEIVKGSALDPRAPEEGKEMSQVDVAVAMLGRAERPELFSIAKSMGIALTATMKTEAMREALIVETRKRAAGLDPKVGTDVKKAAETPPAATPPKKEGETGGAKNDGADEFGPKV